MVIVKNNGKYMADIRWFSQQLTKDVKKITPIKIDSNTVIKIEIFELFFFLNWNNTVLQNIRRLNNKPDKTKIELILVNNSKKELL